MGVGSSPAAASHYSDDLDSQQQDNYAYDEIGNLIKDQQEGITNIEWTVYGKVAKATKQDGSFTEFRHNAAGNRIAKRFKNQAEDRTTHYVQDALSKTLANLTDQVRYQDGSKLAETESYAHYYPFGLEMSSHIGYNTTSRLQVVHTSLQIAARVK